MRSTHTDKWLVSALLMFCLAGCGTPIDPNDVVVSVEVDRSKATTHLEGTRGCHAVRVRDIPAVRHWRNGWDQHYQIQEVVGLEELCK